MRYFATAIVDTTWYHRSGGRGLLTNSLELSWVGHGENRGCFWIDYRYAALLEVLVTIDLVCVHIVVVLLHLGCHRPLAVNIDFGRETWM